ncbi:phage shock envelope stress response protein PspM [Nocardia takedensis]|uniref:phage shock envelope stress response protein PspM n=1 Tax=Nocardia takedensis TaxID=259390 RepID=UPI0006884AD7|nr:hypothetical protein [Nocardia takedensis]
MSRKSSPGVPVAYPHPFAPPASNLPETLRDAGETALVAVRKWADPRERELRRRRRARRRSYQLGTVSGLTTAGAVGLVVISAPVWAVVVIGGGAVALVTGTALSARRYLRLRGKPLPQPGFLPRKQPPLRSVARAPIARLVRAERTLHGLIAHLGASQRVPREELVEMIETANSGAAALHALAADVVQMERALAVIGRGNPAAGEAVSVNMRFALDRLNSGIIEYEQVVSAASTILAVPENSVVAYRFDTIVADLRHAADRLDGWAQALTEIADRTVIATGEPPRGFPGR